MSNESDFKILIVDDEKAELDVLNHILKQDYTVFAAKSGEVALKRVREHKPDLILLDVLMPDMSGFEVLSKLKESESTADIPVIFITGLDSAKDEEKGFSLGAVDYIIKPFNSSVVKARIEKCLQTLKQMRTMERLGMVDALTGIPNRRSFDRQLNVEWSRAIREISPLSILMLDIDDFKTYNDTYGHPQGDLLLQSVARVFTVTIKRPSDIVARYGGEEFAALLPSTGLSGALKVAENVRAGVEETTVKNTSDNSLTSVTVSIGVASMIPTASDTIADFILRADKSLYKAKKMGKNRVCF